MADLSDADIQLAHPVSGTIPQKIVRKQPFNQRLSRDCSTTVSHTMPPKPGSTISDHSTIPAADCSTRVSHRGFSGLWRRGAVYQYRVRVPANLRQIIGATHLNRSLRTASFPVASRLVRTMAYEIERHFENVLGAMDVEGSASAKNSTSPAAVAAVVRPGKFEPGNLPLPVTAAEACERYLGDPASRRTAKSLHLYRTTFATILAIIGPDVPVSSITREICRNVLSLLCDLPPNARKRWPKLSPQEAVAKARAERITPMSSANCNEYMNKLSTLLNWAVREEMIMRNPARGLRIAETVAARDKRLPFSSNQLTVIFNAPLYRGCRDDRNGFAQIGSEQPRRARFWIPLIALFSGMRQGEICQLLTTDVQEVDGILCFAISAGEADGKHLKTSASARLVPVHPMLIQIGFVTYVSNRRRAADVRLFPELMPDRYGRYSGKFSVWFARFLASCSADADRTCFHSFRHSFRDALRAARVEREIALTLGGWVSSSGSEAGAVADTYGRGFSVDVLNSALSIICYPDLDLTHLYS